MIDREAELNERMLTLVRGWKDRPRHYEAKIEVRIKAFTGRSADGLIIDDFTWADSTWFLDWLADAQL